MRRLIVVLAVAALMPVWSGFAPAQARVELSASAQQLDREKLFDAVVARIEEKFFDGAKLKEKDWSARAAAAKGDVVSAPSDAEAVRQINALLRELNTSHTALFTPDDYSYYFLTDIVGGQDSVKELIARSFWGTGPYFAGTGAFTRDVGGRHFVDAVLEGSPAARAGIRYGDEIVSVDGAPYTPVAAFRGRAGSSVALDVRRAPDAPTERIGVAVVPLRPKEAMANAMAASARIIEHHGKRIGYVHVWGILDAAGFKAAIADIEERAGESGKLDGLIVDVRGRVGGSMGTVEKMLEALDAPAKPYWGATRTSENPLRGRQRDGRTTEVSQPPYRGRAVLLIDRGTRSAGEILAQGFRRGGFGPIVGSATAGAVSAASAYIVPGDLLLYVAVTGLSFDGKTLEGVGVPPDHAVERPLAYAAGADPVLEAGLDVLTRTLSR